MQVKEDDSASEPATLPRGVSRLDCQGGFPHPREACHRRHHHGSRCSGWIQQPGHHRQLYLAPGKFRDQRRQLCHCYRGRRCLDNHVKKDVAEVAALHNGPVLPTSADHIASLSAILHHAP